jgi:regulatory factor X 1/2/3
MFSAGTLTQAIRNFAKSLEGWLKSSMMGVPEEMLKTKVSPFCFPV